MTTRAAGKKTPKRRASKKTTTRTGRRPISQGSTALRPPPLRAMPAEFEESEYRGPLFNQIAANQYVWEPGQVFEKHIGIDYALLCTHPLVAKLFNWNFPLRGIQLFRYDFGYIWTKRSRRKVLPSFNLNMFIQAKRPAFVRPVPTSLRANGLGTSAWRFEVTPHQQDALEALSDKLKSRAIVVYASPCFHRARDLYRHTKNRNMVEQSTFPEASKFKNHQAWNYSVPGNAGVANVEPEFLEGPSLIERIDALVGQEIDELDAPSSLAKLAGAVGAAARSSADPFWRTRWETGLQTIDAALDDFELLRGEEARLFLKIAWFGELFRVRWMVVGRAQDAEQPSQAG